MYFASMPPSSSLAPVLHYFDTELFQLFPKNLSNKTDNTSQYLCEMFGAYVFVFFFFSVVLLPYISIQK